MPPLQDSIDAIKSATTGQDQFHQAVDEVMTHVIPFIEGQEDLLHAKIVERLLVPDRILHFRVTWQDDNQDIQINNGWRVQYNNAIGPYKGGLRFHPNVSLDTFKFLGFEQVFKNALTGLAMGGAKGGADFDPKGKSDGEISRFCTAFMMELYKYIGPDQDVPAGDIGVGEREIGYLFGTYKQLTGRHHSVLTGKNPAFGGSCVRKEATGYGCVYFLENVLNRNDESIEGKRCALSGAGNVALYAAKKLIDEGAKVITLSDSGGIIVNPDGIDKEQWETIRTLKEDNQGALADLEDSNLSYHSGKSPWDQDYDIAIPAATQNEIDEEEAKSIEAAGAKFVCEAANMPLTAAAAEKLKSGGISILPSKAANAGGVAVSGLERTQNAQSLSWDFERVDEQLHGTMKEIHDTCVEHGGEDGKTDYVKGANIGGFIRVANAMKAYGVH